MIPGLKHEQMSWQDGAFASVTVDASKEIGHVGVNGVVETEHSISGFDRFVRSRVLPYSGTEGPADTPSFPQKPTSFLVNMIP